jgi:hypothetical protein
MEVFKDNVVNYEQMAIMEKYETLVAYLYPIAQSMPRKHGVARDMFLKCLFGQAELFYEAGKTNQVGKLYVADAGLAQLRFWLRFLVHQSTRGISVHQHKVALFMLSEIGSMLGSWITKRKG